MDINKNNLNLISQRKQWPVVCKQTVVLDDFETSPIMASKTSKMDVFTNSS